MSYNTETTKQITSLLCEKLINPDTSLGQTFKPYTEQVWLFLLKNRAEFINGSSSKLFDHWYSVKFSHRTIAVSHDKKMIEAMLANARKELVADGWVIKEGVGVA